MKLLTAILFIFFSHIPEKKVSIKVIDNETKEEIIGAKVKIDTTTYYTDLYGSIEVDLDEDKKYNVSIESKTYVSKSYINVEAKDLVFVLESK